MDEWVGGWNLNGSDGRIWIHVWLVSLLVFLLWCFERKENKIVKNGFSTLLYLSFYLMTSSRIRICRVSKDKLKDY
jgi:prolipoprotein diacylglyceryltransferase